MLSYQPGIFKSLILHSEFVMMNDIAIKFRGDEKQINKDYKDYNMSIFITSKDTDVKLKYNKTRIQLEKVEIFIHKDYYQKEERLQQILQSQLLNQYIDFLLTITLF